jgi:hypothetical protein
VETLLLHESGEWISCQTPIVCAKQNDPQAFGSAITYAKRYSLQAILGVPSEDDDGESAMERKKKGPTSPELTIPRPPQEVLTLEKIDTERGRTYCIHRKTPAAAKTALAKKYTWADEVDWFIDSLFVEAKS